MAWMYTLAEGSTNPREGQRLTTASCLTRYWPNIQMSMQCQALELSLWLELPSAVNVLPACQWRGQVRGEYAAQL